MLLQHLKDRPADIKEISGRRRGRFLLRETLSIPPSTVDQNCPYLDGAIRGGRPLLRGERSAEHRLGGESGRSRAAHFVVERTANVDRPTMMVFDLDPGPPANI